MFCAIRLLNKVLLNLITLILISTSVLADSVKSELAEFIHENYTKNEYRIPMRDGKTLFTQVYLPNNLDQKYPILFERTPYSIKPYGEAYDTMLGPSMHFAQEKFIFVFQDVRGRYMSEGTFENMRPISNNDLVADESTDAYDTIEWLLENIPNHNGKVGIYGTSYPGFYAAMSLVNSHPALVAVSPQAPMSDLFLGDDGHHYGALYLNHAFTFFGSMGTPRSGLEQSKPSGFQFPEPDAYSFFMKMGPVGNILNYFKNNEWWQQVLEHDTYDTFWQERSIYPHLKGISPAVLVAGGWYDAEDLLGTLQTFYHIKNQNRNVECYFVMGPWTHGNWSNTGDTSLGIFDFKTKAGGFFQKEIELPFFNYYLKGKGDLKELQKVTAFETGSNIWKFYNNWPPENIVKKTLYLESNNKLVMQKPVGSNLNGFDEYISDPQKPVPFTQEITNRVPKTYMVEDQRFAARRPDVLFYSSQELDKDMVVSGPIVADLYVSTSGTDSDWIVKLVDVFPDSTRDPEELPSGTHMGGYQMLVRGEIMRGKFRSSFKDPQPFVPDQITRVKFELPDINHRFLKGHRIMVQIQSTWFPLFDINPQKFCNINKAESNDFQKSVQRIFRCSQYSSLITINVVPE